MRAPPADTPAPRRLLHREWLAVGVIAAATLWACWPLSALRAFPKTRDAIFPLLALERIQDALLGRGDPWSIGLAWPAPGSVTQSDWLLGEAVLALPLRAIGLDPLLVGPVLALLGLFGTAWAVHRLAVLLLGPGPHTWVAGIAGGLSPTQLLHLQHVNLVHHELTVAAAALLGVGLAGRRPGVACAGGLLLACSAHFGAYLGIHTAVVGGIVVAALALTRQGSARAWLAAAGGAALGGATLLPVAAAYVDVAVRFGTWFDLSNLRAESWDLARTLAPVPTIPLHADWLGVQGRPVVDPPNPGYVAAALAGLGLWGLRRGAGVRWAWGAVLATALVAGLLALGPELVWDGQPTGVPGPYRLFAALPGMRGIRSPARWLAVAFLALALPAGLGARLLLGWVRARVGGVAAGVAAAGLVGALLAETPQVQDEGRAADLVLEDVYRPLDELAPGALLDLALLSPRRDGCGEPLALRAAIFHGRALVGGMFARRIPELEGVYAVAQTWPSPDALELLAAIGVVAVIEHTPSGDAPPGATCEWAGDHRLCRLDGPTRAPLPTADSVQVAGAGPVVGLRYPARTPLPASIDVACGRDRHAAGAATWRALSELRHGAGGPVDILFAEPCEKRVAASVPGALMLHAAATTEPFVLPPPRTTRTVADSFRTLGMRGVTRTAR